MGTCDFCWKISCGHYPPSLLGYRVYASLGKNACVFGPTGIHKQSLVVCMWPVNVCWKLCIHQNLPMSAQNTQPPAIFSGLSSNKNIYLPKQEVECKLALLLQWRWVVGCWVTLPLILWSRPALAAERCGHVLHSAVSFSWDDQSSRVSSPGKLFAICYVKTCFHQEGLEEINAWQEELLRLKRKAKLCEIQHGARICNLGLDQWP